MKKDTLQKTITISSVILIITHLLFPVIAIDFVTVTLLAIAVIPWLSPLFKSIGLPGGMSAEFRDLSLVKENIEKAGLLKPAHYRGSFYIPSRSDPNLVLAWLRIEIEKRVRNLSEKNNIKNDGSMSRMLQELEKNSILSQREVSVLQDLKVTLNRAIHGMKVDTRTAKWVLDVGPQVLTALDDKINI